MNNKTESTVAMDNFTGMRICVLQPDYSTSAVDYQNYDPPRNLSRLIPGAQVDHIFLNKLTTYRQLKELKKKNYDVFVNLCEGYLEWDVPSIDVIFTLELLNLPFTGPTTLLYDPPKELMKYVAHTTGISTPAFVMVESVSDVEQACQLLHFPMFVKPHKAGDSLGIDDQSLVTKAAELEKKVASIIDEYGPLLVEEYVAGREFTVMLASSGGDEEPLVFEPLEYVFPGKKKFKTYSLKTSELHPEANIAVRDPELATRLKDSARAIFEGFDGVGYARLDFRMGPDSVLYFLEINFTCSVFYEDGYEGSADYILKHDGFGQANFLQHIIKEGISRFRRQQKRFLMKGNSIAGYGIYAAEDLSPDELVFKGEEMPQRIVTRRHVEENWSIREKEIFRRYAYPVSKEVFLLWDKNPNCWAPQNHSCSPNTVYDGLNVKVTRSVKKGEELTLDYTSFLDENMEPFICHCGSPECRSLISGIPNNSVTERETRPAV